MGSPEIKILAIDTVSQNKKIMQFDVNLEEEKC